jgi:hypothetical protein
MAGDLKDEAALRELEQKKAAAEARVIELEAAERERLARVAARRAAKRDGGKPPKKGEARTLAGRVFGWLMGDDDGDDGE